MNPAMRVSLSIAVTCLAAAVASPPALAQDTPAGPKDAEAAAPPPARVRVVLNGAAWVGGNPTFGGTRTFDEYAEQTTIRTSYETGSAWGPDAAVQVRVYRDFGVRVGFSSASREVFGALDVSRPHPLHFDRPRAATAELGDLSYSERALHLDLAFARSVGHLDWSLFAGVTLFQVEAEVLGEVTFNDVYPFHELAIASTSKVTVESSPVGFNVGGGLDYRFGRSGRFGLGVQLLYSTGDAELQATPESDASAFKTGGLQVGAGLRVYF